MLDIDSYHYLSNARRFVENWDLLYGVVKSVFFGGAIALIACYRGFHCTAGAEGVGRAATASFVYSFIVILALDLFLSILLDEVYYALWPESPTLG